MIVVASYGGCKAGKVLQSYLGCRGGGGSWAQTSLSTSDRGYWLLRKRRATEELRAQNGSADPERGATAGRSLLHRCTGGNAVVCWHRRRATGRRSRVAVRRHVRDRRYRVSAAAGAWPVPAASTLRRRLLQVVACGPAVTEATRRCDCPCMCDNHVHSSLPIVPVAATRAFTMVLVAWFLQRGLQVVTRGPAGRFWVLWGVSSVPVTVQLS